MGNNRSITDFGMVGSRPRLMPEEWQEWMAKAQAEHAAEREDVIGQVLALVKPDMTPEQIVRLVITELDY